MLSCGIEGTSSRVGLNAVVMAFKYLRCKTEASKCSLKVWHWPSVRKFSFPYIPSHDVSHHFENRLPVQRRLFNHSCNLFFSVVPLHRFNGPNNQSPNNSCGSRQFFLVELHLHRNIIRGMSKACVARESFCVLTVLMVVLESHVLCNEFIDYKFRKRKTSVVFKFFDHTFQKRCVVNQVFFP